MMEKNNNKNIGGKILVGIEVILTIGLLAFGVLVLLMYII